MSYRTIIVISIVAFLLQPLALPCSAAQAASADVQTYFRGDCEQAICREVAKADKTILVAAFALTSNYIVDALLDASRRGVMVRMKIDRQQAETEASSRLIKRLRTGQVSVHTIGMPEHYSMHNKFLVIDDKIVLTGSFNFTIAAARENWENLILVDSTVIASAFRQEWETIKTRKQPVHRK